MNDPGPIDARQFLESLVGEAVFTIDSGAWNHVVGVEGSDVVVATRQSPKGARVPVSLVEQAAVQLQSAGEIRIHPDALGHRRSSFVGAVLARHPSAVGLSNPSRVRLRGISPIRPLLSETLQVVRVSRTSPYISRDDPLYDLVVRRLRDAVAAQVADERSYKTEGSVGRGNWAETPWVAVFDLNVTDTATRGFYIVYLFRTDGSAAYLSLNQGATAVAQTVGRQRYTAVLQARAATYREYLAAEDLEGLLVGPIDLGGGRPPLTPGYEAANVVATRYFRDALPAEEALEEDLHRLLGLYRALVPEIDQVRAGEEEQLPSVPAQREEARRLRWHLRAEGRNRRAVEDAKRFHGYRCQACGTDFLGRFGDPGKRCIEAHHLVPFAQLAERPQAINPTTDFAIVCANCHRILHSATPPLAVDDVRHLFDGST